MGFGPDVVPKMRWGNLVAEPVVFKKCREVVRRGHNSWEKTRTTR
jgi:hypothetical protein